MKKKYKIVALIGESGSGKDTVLRETVQKYPELHKIITCTTRPPREYEDDGVDYHFYSHEDFIRDIWNKKIIDLNMEDQTPFIQAQIASVMFELEGTA